MNGNRKERTNDGAGGENPQASLQEVRLFGCMFSGNKVAEYDAIKINYIISFCVSFVVLFCWMFCFNLLVILYRVISIMITIFQSAEKVPSVSFWLN